MPVELCSLRPYRMLAMCLLISAFCSAARGEEATLEANSDGNKSPVSEKISPWQASPVLVGKEWVHLFVPQPRPEDRDIEIELNLSEPLDLSELALSLVEIPKLPANSDAYQEPTPSSHLSKIKLAANEEPVVIGGSTSSSKTEGAVSNQPANPLRINRKSDESSSTLPTDREPKTPPSEPNPIEPIRSEPSQEPITIGGASNGKATRSIDAETKPQGTAENDAPLLMLDEPTSPSNDTEFNGGQGESTLPSRPKLRAIELGRISDDEQEAPSLSKPESRSAKPKNARDEDATALDAKRPEANQKTFIGKPSSARISDSSRGMPASDPNSKRTQRVDSCLAYYLTHLETTVERSPWSVMHAMLPYGVEGEILVGNRKVNAIQWLCNNGTCRGQRLFTPVGRYFKPNIGGGVQGHEGQFLAMLAQSQVSAEYPMTIGPSRYTVADLVRYEMATCRERTELTFKLMGLSYYVDTSQVWTTDRSSRWNIEKLVKEELAQPINGASCGGVHRLMGLTFAVRQRQAEGRPIDGHFARADKFVKDFVAYTWQLQNPDGSFSTNWFEARGNEPKMERKVQTTGHILEWLAFTLPEEELQSPRFLKSLDFLLSRILDEREHKWPIGPRGHATRAVALFQQRTRGVQPGHRREALAEEIQSIMMQR
jgi:hypothetical protein